MNLTSIAIVAIVCWAIVRIVNGNPKQKNKPKTDKDMLAMQHEYEMRLNQLSERIETLEKIVTDEKYALRKEFEAL
jgi:hypothetical protein